MTEKINDNNPFVPEEQEVEQEESLEIPEVVVDAEIETLKSELETYKNQYLRMAADFDNYRKRQAEERESLLKYGAVETLKKILPVIDTFDRAKKSIVDVEDAQKLKESVDVIYKQFNDVLEKVGLQKIDTVGVEFDPAVHEAVMQTPTSEHPENTIIVELQSGYKLGEKVIRPALVNVAVSE